MPSVPQLPHHHTRLKTFNRSGLTYIRRLYTTDRWQNGVSNRRFCCTKGLGGLVVRCRPRSWRVTGSKPNSTEDPSYIRPVSQEIMREVSNALPLVA
ncbi:hypothetical protein AVEN_127861-1 [Araneus ventricosus]|uniref:Uncharacterized protein n=1 Tax=Araneus ventricosus TaxID=182803 RepID=A0A4Y1ZZV1_ARAVE|nr:hypothetical protein AVEN_127861-1 [Araneus ventricosus]